MKIIHVNLARGFRGGERQTVTLIQALAQQNDLQQVLVCRNHSPMREALKNLPHLSFVDARAQWQGHFQAGRADVVHAHEARAAHWAYLHHLMLKTPYLITRRVDFALKKAFLTQETYCSAAVLVAISHAVAEKLRHFAVPVEVIADSFSKLPENPARTQALRQQFAHQFVIGHIGALVDAHKGQADLIEVARQFATQYPDCVFLFLGSGADEAQFKAQSQDLDNVYWLGFQEDVGSYLAAMDVFAFPSRTEGLGSTLLDAMVYGVPIVASNVGGIPDIVQDGKTGLLFQVNDASDLAEKISQLYRQPELGSHLAQQAKEQLKHFSPEAIAAQYRAIYARICTVVQNKI
ncbi:MAG: glycosyltransferase family 4 protein [Alysiella sp.]|uniref:glycosyltransferase family 4 protein n=1 Tax=Alysiella sp. TaxID=1872483 RepID=UPI0026DBC5B7|nr:glycosyltransferase family 4 protein [Alysiella sp.]MDO4433741.1 glycosyltransferase family 4 protein [Alysiella sp.]